MKHHSKYNKPKGLVIAFLFMLPNVYAADNAANTGLREEASTLENIYQEKARATLDTLLNPDDYTLVISATLKNDEAKLKEYHAMVEKKFLPGMMMNDPAGFGEEHNILHALKQKVEIQVILNDRVPSDRDTMVRDILKSKLKLNEEGGDTIGVIRAFHTSPFIDPALAKKLPEFSGRMISFLLLLAGLLVAGVAMWLYKRHQNKLEEAQAQGAKMIERERLKEAIQEEKEEETAVAAAADHGKTPEELEAERRILEQKINEGREELTALAQEYSNIVNRALEEFVAQGKIYETTLFLENIGWDQSRKIFKNIDSKLWTRIATSLRDRTEDPTREQTYQAIHVFQRFALSYVLEKAGGSSENPFAFIFQLSHSQRMDLLQNESTYNIALISIYSTGAQMGDLMAGLDAEMQNEIFFNITKIKHLPESEVHNGITTLLSRLENIKKTPSIHIDGLDLAAKFIRSLEPLKEESLYQSIQTQHPEEANRLRRTQVMFQDIPSYPVEMVKKVIDNLDSDDVQKSLAGYPTEFVDSFLSLLPTKKALMIQNDLFHMTDAPPPYQSAAARRKITDLVEQEFIRAKFSVSDFWKLHALPGSLNLEEVTEVTSIIEAKLQLVNNEEQVSEENNDDADRKSA